MTDSKKAELFNSFLKKQCSIINNSGKLPTSFDYIIEKRLDSVIFSIDEIGNIIQGLDLNKVHGQNKISIHMLKICGNSICKPLEIIYKECPSLYLFPL